MNYGLLRYARPTKKEIVYNVLPTSNGWQIQAFLPDKISLGDCYRFSGASRTPYLITFFHFGEQSYFLDIIRADDPKELIGQLVELAQVWKQMDLEYA